MLLLLPGMLAIASARPARHSGSLVSKAKVLGFQYLEVPKELPNFLSKNVEKALHEALTGTAHLQDLIARSRERPPQALRLWAATPPGSVSG